MLAREKAEQTQLPALNFTEKRKSCRFAQTKFRNKQSSSSDCFSSCQNLNISVLVWDRFFLFVKKGTTPALVNEITFLTTTQDFSQIR